MEFGKNLKTKPNLTAREELYFICSFDIFFFFYCPRLPPACFKSFDTLVATKERMYSFLSSYLRICPIPILKCVNFQQQWTLACLPALV